MRPYTSYLLIIIVIGSGKMNNIIDNLYDNILKSTRDISKIDSQFASIIGNTICIGSGGSKVVATYASKVLGKRNRGLCDVFDASCLTNSLNNYDNILVCSYSGSNYGVKHALSNDKKHYLFSGRKTKVSDETLIHYEMENEESFISLGATVIPMAIILKYYLQDKFDDILKDIFSKIDKSIFLEFSFPINIFTDSSSISALTFLESSLVESGISIPLIHYKYDYCHGRSTINKSHKNNAIIFNKGLDIDSKLIEVIKSTMNKYLIISSPYEDDIISDFYYTLQSLYLLCNVAKSKNIDLRNINYDRIAVKNLYHFKGSM